MLRNTKMTNQDIFDKIFKCLHYIISIFTHTPTREYIYIENDYGSTCINALFYEIEIDSRHM